MSSNDLPVSRQAPDVPSDRETLKYWCTADDNDLHEIRLMYKHRRRYHNFMAGEVDLNPRTIQWKLRQLDENNITYMEWTLQEDRELLEMYSSRRVTGALEFSEKYPHRSVMAVHRREMFLVPLVDRVLELYPDRNFDRFQLPTINQNVPGVTSCQGRWGSGNSLTADEGNIAVEIVHFYGETDIKVDIALERALGRKCKTVLDMLHAFANRHPATWTQAEDKILINQARELHEDWQAICEKLPRRTIMSAQERYKNLMRASKVVSIGENHRDSGASVAVL